MRAGTTLSRALSKISVDTHRQMHSRAQQARYYELAEREHQFQYPIKGTLGLLPVEVTFKILFDVAFLYEYGIRRDSQLLEPRTHFGFSALSGPAGTVPYAHVLKWIQDEDLNYIGCHVIVGIHNPLISATGTGSLTSVKFSATLHCSFQGYGHPMDNDDPSDNPSIDQGNSQIGNPGSASGGSTPPTSNGPSPNYPAGPLGGSSGWSTVATFNSLDDFSIPAGEGALKVDAGLLTTTDWRNVTTQPSGDKYAAKFTAAGRVGGGYKARVRFLMNPGPDQYANIQAAVVVNMEDRQNGLAFTFGNAGIGWITDLRLLGTNKALAAIQGAAGPTNGQSISALTYDSNTLGNTPRPDALHSFASHVPDDVWLELWRHGNTISAALYSADPAAGATPIVIATYDVTHSTKYGPSDKGYFGWTFNEMDLGIVSSNKTPVTKQGIKSMTVFKES